MSIQPGISYADIRKEPQRKRRQIDFTIFIVELEGITTATLERDLDLDRTERAAFLVAELRQDRITVFSLYLFAPSRGSLQAFEGWEAVVP